jgi:uncharacterized protein (TIGR03067 family)
MRTTHLLACAACVAAIAWQASGVRAADSSEQDVAAMQGVWKVESVTLDGNEVLAENLKNWHRIVEGSHVAWKDGETTLIELDIKLDPTQKPKTIESTIATGDDKGKVLLGIYELKDNVLRVCFANPDRPRPTEFSSTPDSGQSIYTARRVKP